MKKQIDSLTVKHSKNILTRMLDDDSLQTVLDKVSTLLINNDLSKSKYSYLDEDACNILKQSLCIEKDKYVLSDDYLNITDIDAGEHSDEEKDLKILEKFKSLSEILLALLAHVRSDEMAVQGEDMLYDVSHKMVETDSKTPTEDDKTSAVIEITLNALLKNESVTKYIRDIIGKNKKSKYADKYPLLFSFNGELNQYEFLNDFSSYDDELLKKILVELSNEWYCNP